MGGGGKDEDTTEGEKNRSMRLVRRRYEVGKV
jgi:hypothetical protein